MKFNFDIAAIFNLYSEDIVYRKRDKTISICSQDMDLLHYLAKTFEGNVTKCWNFGKVVLNKEKSKEFLEWYKI